MNSSFEIFLQCPDDFSEFDNGSFSGNTINWVNPLNNSLVIPRTTPDLYNVCSNYNTPTGLNVGIPRNGRGRQYPVTGNGYAGIVTYWNDNPYGGPFVQWREYLQTANPIFLQPGVIYDISFYASLSNNSGWATKNLGFFLSRSNDLTSYVQQDGFGAFIDLSPSYENPTYLSDLGSWTLVQSTFSTSLGGTFYLTIGDFSNNNSPIPTVNNSLDGFAYYYIDDVTIKEHPGCCPTDLTISNTTLTGTEIFGATNSITVGPNVNTDPGADVTLVADNYIEFLPGANLGPGVNAEIGECPGAYQNVSTSPPANTNTAEIITPDGDGNSDQFCVTIIGALQYSVQVSDLLGNIVYVINNANVDSQPQCIWDGTCNFGSLCNNQAVPAAFYILTLTSFGCSGPVISNFLIDVEYPFMRIVNATPQSIDSIINSQLKIFPNPATEKLFIEFPATENSSHAITVFDSEGKIALTKGASETDGKTELDLTSLASGIYFVQVKNAEGKIIGSKKIIRE